MSRRLREPRNRDQEITISGRITELRESGWVKVKTGTAKNSPAYDVRFEEPQDLLRMRPGLGDNVHFPVRFRQGLDSVGIARSTEYTYLGPAAEQIRFFRSNPRRQSAHVESEGAEGAVETDGVTAHQQRQHPVGVHVFNGAVGW